MKTIQRSLFDPQNTTTVAPVKKKMVFDGSDYLPSRDDARLTNQYNKIFDLMKDGVWRTLDEISKATDAPHASVSAQLRHCRQARNGGHFVNKKYLGSGLFSYQLILNKY